MTTTKNLRNDYDEDEDKVRRRIRGEGNRRT
jgi:hypothetical protein